MDKAKRIEKLTSIIHANVEFEMHFRKLHQEARLRRQDTQHQLFEMKAKLEELNQEKNLLTGNDQSHKSIFSPIRNDSQAAEKKREKDEDIRKAQACVDDLTKKLSDDDACIVKCEDQMEMLRESLSASISLAFEIGLSEDDFTDPVASSAIRNADLKKEENESEEGVPETTTLSVSPLIAEHGKNILRLDAFDKTYISTILRTRIINGLTNQQNRLTNLRRMIQIDPEQAKLLSGELEKRNEELLSTLYHQLRRLQPDFDEKQPIYRTLDEWIMTYRENHPEFVMDSELNCVDESMTLPYIPGSTLYQLLTLFTDNIAEHADANRIRLKIDITESRIEVFLHDNGTGIPEDYLSTSPWYSSLHKAEELVFLLGGRLNITGSRYSGTTVELLIPLD
jgi:two-component system sensor histidine kinase DegS